MISIHGPKRQVRPWPPISINLFGRHPPIHREVRDLMRARMGGERA